MTLLESLRDRTAAQSVMEEVLRCQDEASPRRPLARLLGICPLTDEARSWYSGACGELLVGRLLAGLPAEWTVVHSVPVGKRGSDIDHVVIGPGGVFTINTKRHPGKRVWVGGRTFMVSGHRQPYIRNAEHESNRIARLLADSGVRQSVFPVIAVVGAKELTVRSRPEAVTVITADRLVRWLRRAPAVLVPEQTQEIVGVLDRSLQVPAGELPDDILSRFLVVHQEVRSAAQVRAIWAVGGLGIPAAAAAWFAIAPLLQLA